MTHHPSISSTTCAGPHSSFLTHSLMKEWQPVLVVITACCSCFGRIWGTLFLEYRFADWTLAFCGSVHSVTSSVCHHIGRSLNYFSSGYNNDSESYRSRFKSCPCLVKLLTLGEVCGPYPTLFSEVMNTKVMGLFEILNEVMITKNLAQCFTGMATITLIIVKITVVIMMIPTTASLVFSPESRKYTTH